MRRFLGLRRSDPSLFMIVARAFAIVQDRIARSRLAGDPSDVLIAPKVGDVALFEFYRAAESIIAGEMAETNALPDIRAAIQRHAGGARYNTPHDAAEKISDRLVGAEQNLDPPVTHELRIVECATSNLVIRHARLHQRGPNRIHASLTQALMVRVRSAIDSDLE